MNAIGFVFCILTILSFGAILSLEKQVSAHRLRSTYVGHIMANKAILDQTTSEFYASLKHLSSSDEKEKEKKKEETKSRELPPPPVINPSCARLNLSPLIEHDSQQESYLYETAAKLIKVFYGQALFDNEARSEYKFLDTFLKEVRSQIVRKEFSTLEKVSFKDRHYQMLYYKMLKGTKQIDLLKGMGYPSLLDYIKIEPNISKICLYHAHPNLLSIFFTAKGAMQLYKEMHTPKAPPITQETIERICREVHAPFLQPEVFDCFEMSRSAHSVDPEKTLIGEDPESRISLRKVISIHGT